MTSKTLYVCDICNNSYAMCTDCPKNCPLDNEEDTRKYSADYYKGRADEKEEDNEFFNFDKVIEIEKNKSYQQGRADAIQDIRVEIANRVPSRPITKMAREVWEDKYWLLINLDKKLEQMQKGQKNV